MIKCVKPSMKERNEQLVEYLLHSTGDYHKEVFGEDGKWYVKRRYKGGWQVVTFSKESYERYKRYGDELKGQLHLF